MRSVDLFGSDDLMGSGRQLYAAEMLSVVEPAVLAARGLRREDLLPVAVSPVDLDLFVMTRQSAAKPGVVIWLAGTEIDRFPCFDDYFQAMIDYN